LCILKPSTNGTTWASSSGKVNYAMPSSPKATVFAFKYSWIYSRATSKTSYLTMRSLPSMLLPLDFKSLQIYIDVIASKHLVAAT